MKVRLSYVTEEGPVEYEKEILDESMGDLIKIIDYISEMEDPEEIIYVNEVL